MALRASPWTNIAEGFLFLLSKQAADDSRVNMDSAFEMLTTDIPWSRPAVGDATLLFTERHSLPFWTSGEGDVRSRSPLKKKKNTLYAFFRVLYFRRIRILVARGPTRSSA